MSRLSSIAGLFAAAVVGGGVAYGVMNYGGDAPKTNPKPDVETLLKGSTAVKTADSQKLFQDEAAMKAYDFTRVKSRLGGEQAQANTNIENFLKATETPETMTRLSAMAKTLNRDDAFATLQKALEGADKTEAVQLNKDKLGAFQDFAWRLQGGESKDANARSNFTKSLDGSFKDMRGFFAGLTAANIDLARLNGEEPPVPPKAKTQTTPQHAPLVRSLPTPYAPKTITPPRHNAHTATTPQYQVHSASFLGVFDALAQNDLQRAGNWISDQPHVGPAFRDLLDRTMMTTVKTAAKFGEVPTFIPLNDGRVQKALCHGAELAMKIQQFPDYSHMLADLSAKGYTSVGVSLNKIVRDGAPYMKRTNVPGSRC